MDESIVLKNKLYPRGLTEKDIKKYWKDNHSKIIRETDRSNVLLFISKDINDLIVKRKHSNKPIIINRDNWETFLTGRTLQVSIETSDITNRFVLDIDAKENVPERIKKDVLRSMIEFFYSIRDKYDFEKFRIINTSNSYNIMFYTRYKTKRKYLFEVVFSELYEQNYDNLYDINKKRKTRDINLDFTPMYNRGTFTCPYSLNRNGTKSMDITNSWENWNRKESILK